MKIGTFETHPAADAFPLFDDGAFASLVEDIKRNGLRTPIEYVDEGKRQLIIDGRNRLRACIEAKVKPAFKAFRGKDIVGHIVSLNLERRHMNESQRALAAERLAKLRKFAQGDAAEMLNVSRRTVQHARTVLAEAAPEVVAAVDRGVLAVSAAAELAKRPKAEQRELAKRMTTGKVDGKEVRASHVRALVRQAERREVVHKINTAQVPPPPVGSYRLIVWDPPWPYGNSDGHKGARGHITYPPMPIEEICRLGATTVARFAHDEGCILGTWITNAFVHEYGRVLAACGGFVHRSAITWAKDRVGMGPTWPRGQTEHLLLASRGAPVHTLNELTTLIHAPVREHSRKPDEILDALAKHCPGPRLDMFAREPREGWHAWGAESQKFGGAA